MFSLFFWGGVVHSLLASQVSGEVCSHCSRTLSPFVMSSSLTTLKILSWPVAQHRDYDVGTRGFLCASCIWGFLSFLNLYIYAFCQMWGVFSHFFPFFFNITSFIFPSLLASCNDHSFAVAEYHNLRRATVQVKRISETRECVNMFFKEVSLGLET
jgi:hypothetical protein